MKEKIRKSDDESVLDILVGTRILLKPLRPVGRLPQLNKHAKKIRSLHRVSETYGRSQS